MNEVNFPGLGLHFELNPVAFTLFGVEVRWYGVILTLGIVAAFLYFYLRATKTEKIDPDHLYNMALFTVPLGIIGARFIYVITKWDEYKGDFFKIINIRGGGLAIYGAIIFGGLTVFVYCRVRKLSFLQIADALAPGVMLGQAIGRWGNFVNAEAYGSSTNVGKLFCRMEIDGVCYHPTFFYESLWNVVGFLLINLIFYKRKKANGQIFFVYLGWYGFGRAWIELLRTDSLYIVGNIKFSVVVGILSVIASVIGLVLLSRYAKKEQADAEALTYKPKFAKASVVNEPDPETEEAEKETEEAKESEAEAEAEENEEVPEEAEAEENKTEETEE